VTATLKQHFALHKQKLGGDEKPVGDSRFLESYPVD
jgi:hypothetical protein